MGRALGFAALNTRLGGLPRCLERQLSLSGSIPNILAQRTTKASRPASQQVGGSIVRI